MVAVGLAPEFEFKTCDEHCEKGQFAWFRPLCGLVRPHVHTPQSIGMCDMSAMGLSINGCDTSFGQSATRRKTEHMTTAGYNGQCLSAKYLNPCVSLSSLFRLSALFKRPI